MADDVLPPEPGKAVLVTETRAGISDAGDQR
jgi:hypothetical protein